MRIPLLKTKLYVPPLRPGLVARPRLVERLNAGQHCKLTLVCAPAGFGKTTLLSAWINQSPNTQYPIPNTHPKTAWVSLDAGDNEPFRFAAYLLSAVGQIQDDVAAGLLDALQSPQPPLHEALLISLVNALAAISAPLTIVLDDYHVITAPAVHAILTFVLDHLPPQMHLVVASRTAPPLPLARLCARGQLLELDSDDLRFTPEQAAAFLRATSPGLAPQDVKALAAYTEGWVAGLQMAALAAQKRGRVADLRRADGYVADGYVADGYVADGYVAEYLLQEVLDQQPQATRDFLLQTSILERLSGPLCDALIGQQDSQATLQELERDNLFIEPLDDQRQWYRYHGLFASSLLLRLRQTQPQRLPELHRRAAAWHAQNDLLPAAVRHSLAAQDWERATRLIEQIAFAMLLRGEATTLLNWLEALPEALTRSHAHLSLIHAWALVHCAQPGAAEARALQAQALLDGAQGRLSGQVEAVRTLISNSQGDHARTIALARRALERLPQDDYTRRGIVALELGLAHAALNDAPAACAAFEQSVAIGLAAGNAAIAVLALSSWAELQALQGELALAERSCQQALRQAAAWAARHGRLLSFAGDAHVCLGQLLYERDELDAAERHASRGVALSQQRGSLAFLIKGYAILSLTRQARGDPAGASQALDEAEQALASASSAARQIRSAEPGHRLTQVEDALARHKATLWLLQDNVLAAARWARERNLSSDDELSRDPRACGSVLRDSGDDFYTCLTLARLLLAQHKPAIPLLKRLLQSADAQGWTGRVIQVLALQACALQTQGNTGQALVVLSRALLLAEPQGFVRSFVDAGACMPALLRQAAKRESAGYAAQLLAKCEKRRTPNAERRTLLPGASSSVPGPSSLTGRELQVLQLIAQNIPNQEIAARLFISVNTVKTHVKRIYAKLGVHDRFQAIQRAAELDLLPPGPL